MEKIKLDRMQFIDCALLEQKLVEMEYEFPKNKDILDMFPEAENGSFQWLDLYDTLGEIDEAIEQGDTTWDELLSREQDQYHFCEAVQKFLKDYTDNMDPDGIYVYVAW